MSFVANRKASEAALTSHAGCLITGAAFSGRGDWAIVRVEEPRSAFARVLRALYASPTSEASIHPTAMIAETAQVSPECSIGPYVSIRDQSVIERGCRIADGCFIGSAVHMGENTILHPNVTIYDRVRVGANVILHSGCVVGADGFGFVLTGDHYERFPQVGTVMIEDDVEVGANCCIDRAALGTTRIGRGTKLDNLVHVAHNCDIGRHVLVAAQTGFSGSVTVGDYAVIGGQTGIGEKARIEANAVIGGKAGILTGQTIRAGEPVWGIPARPLRQHLKGLANIGKIPELRTEVNAIKKLLINRDAGKIRG
jgi:UDP-3-O-[3-hydroxymyristoyl] glucosamine N-acyltransferase